LAARSSVGSGGWYRPRFPTAGYDPVYFLLLLERPG
jgi:hypothetical protein